MKTKPKRRKDLCECYDIGYKKGRADFFKEFKAELICENCGKSKPHTETWDYCKKCSVNTATIK